MLLPLPAVRAALRLDTAEKRLAWAAEQLAGGLVASPAAAVDTVLGIAAKPVTRGIVGVPFNDLNAYAKATRNNGIFEGMFRIPFDMAQYNRGVPLLRCVGQLSTDLVLPFVGVVAAGEPILDTSPTKLLEQYLIEQLSLIIVNNVTTIDLTKTNLRVVSTNWYNGTTYQLINYIEINFSLVYTGMVSGDRYNDITGAVAQ